MTIEFKLTPVDKVPEVERKVGTNNAMAKQYDAMVEVLKANPGQSFRLVEKVGTQAMVAQLKRRGVWAGLRNTTKGGASGKTVFGDLYAFYAPQAAGTGSPVSGTGDVPGAPENGVPAPILPLQGHGAPGDATFTATVPAPESGSIAGVPVDEDGMPITG